MSTPEAEGLDLPPTLQPSAIFRAAPPSDPRLSIAITLHVYALLLVLGWVYFRPGRRDMAPIREEGRQTITLRLEEHPAEGPPSFRPSNPGGPASAGSPVEVFTLPLRPTVPDSVLPLSELKRELTEWLPPPDGAGPSPSEFAGGAGQGSGPGSDKGKKPGKGTGQTMFHAVPGVSPGMDLNDLEVIHEEIPTYPLLAEWGRIQGDVVVRVTINEKGIPIRTELQEGPPALQAETMRAVKRWRFGSGVFRGKKLEVTFDMTFRYILR